MGMLQVKPLLLAEFTVTLNLIEIIILQLGAIILGVSVHFFITSISGRKNIRRNLEAQAKGGQHMDEWKLKYYNELESRNKELGDFKDKLMEAEERSNILTIEIDEMRKENRNLKAELLTATTASASISHKPEDKGSYIDQLKAAQSSLLEHNQKISKLLEQVDLVKASEEKHEAAVRNNEQLNSQLQQLRVLLNEKEKLINQIKQKEHLTQEMTARLDSAYEEFNLLQDKMLKLETQLTSSRHISLEYDDLQEAYKRVSRDLETHKQRSSSLSEENQRLNDRMEKLEDELREANFQKQQLQKKLVYLEELNSDLQLVSDHSKNLESQLKRVGELESMLNMVMEERNALQQEKVNTMVKNTWESDS
jgi:hypothetical protein